MQDILNKSFLRACLDITGLNFWISLFIFSIGFANSILIIVMLYKIFNYKQLNMRFTVEILLALIANRFFLGYLQLILEKKMRRNFCTRLTEYFISSSWNLDNKSLMSTLISRDILLLLDTIPAIPKLFYFPICFIMGIAVIYLLIGLSGVIAISTVIFFIPISFFIARKSIHLTGEIYDFSKLRLGEMSRWLEWRPIINNWADSNILIKRIVSLTEKELHRRALDSIWRSLDLYIITFGRCFPVAILILISMLFKNDISKQLLLTIWLSVPFIGLIMEAGRFATNFQLGKKAFIEMQKSSKRLSISLKPYLILDDNWEIWDGILTENCLEDKDNADLGLLKKLRLNDELRVADDEVHLLRFGSNISEGQKTRILIIRAIHMALKSDMSLKIERSLSSLDPDACHRLIGILQEPYIVDKVTLSQSCKDFLKHQTQRDNSRQTVETKTAVFKNNDYLLVSTQKLQIANIIKDLFGFFNSQSLLFLLPAISLSFVGYIAIVKIMLITKLITILVVSILSIILVVYLGAKNEDHTRQWAKNRTIDIMLNATLKNTTDLFQRLSRDFTTVVERISWYIHDITWLFSLLLVSVIATVISFGMLGVLIVGIFLLFSFGLWRFFEIKINNARAISVDMVNQLLVMGENLVCYGELANYFYIDKLRRAMIKNNVNGLYQSSINLISLKANFSNLIMCVSGLFILAALSASTYSWISPGSLVFILTAILAVDASLGILFQALFGFSAQRISIHRLSDFERNNQYFAGGMIVKNQDNYLFKGAINPKTGVSYFPLMFEAGNSYSVLGKSGIGKTQFLKLISGLHDESKIDLLFQENIARVLYVNNDSYKIISWVQDELSYSKKWSKERFIKFISDKIFRDKFKVIAIDEALIDFSLTEANEIISLIQGYISQADGLLLLVDHRFSLDKSISISKIQSVMTM
ncbi:MAG: hypothetical protein P4M14_07680 [Gammaproteobacteria bacterium]|nr:hypothetical protein [Gammaproteobacteria bacterium]